MERGDGDGVPHCCSSVQRYEPSLYCGTTTHTCQDERRNTGISTNIITRLARRGTFRAEGVPGTGQPILRGPMAPTLGGTLRFEDEEMERMLIAERFASSYVTTQIGLFINSCACVAFMFRVDDGAKRALLAVLVVGFVVIIIVRAWLERYEDRVLAHRYWSFASAVFVLTALPPPHT